MFFIYYKPGARKNLKKLPKKLQLKIIHAIEGLGKNPYLGKKLHGQLDGLYSVRVWPYRIIYSIQGKILTIEILHIGHRQGIYK